MRDRGATENECCNTWEFRAGETLVIRDAGSSARRAGLRNGDEVVLVSDTNCGYNPEALIDVHFNGKTATLRMGEVCRARSRTGHSTQGLERDVVVIGIISSRAATRKWLFTSVSRSRKRCIVVCTRDSLAKCIENDPRRRTLLPALLDRVSAAFRTNPPVKKRLRKAGKKKVSSSDSVS